MFRDTIAAVATPPGEGGIGVVRLSGPDSRPIVERLFEGRLADRRVVHGLLRDPLKGDVVDEVLATYMAAPRTYTAEDVVEISCHGSPLVLQRVLEMAFREGARPANPGEFTLRAFLNGRIDLAQAESVLDIIQAQTNASLRLAVQGLGGRLSEPIHRVYGQVLQVQAYLTACIDFPEDEVESQMEGDPTHMLNEAADVMAGLMEAADAGMAYRFGVKTAIIGRPNVGKSSLLNRLLGEERAIVTELPGTTRDTVEESFSAHGVPFHLVDTAGIQQTADTVEEIGVQRSRKAVEQADLVLLVVDSSLPLTDDDSQIRGLAKDKPIVSIANKCDLPERASLGDLPAPLLRVSALTGQGMDALHGEMARVALGGTVVSSDAVMVTNPRHKAALGWAQTHLHAAQESLQKDMPADFVTIGLGACLTALGEITGENVDEALLDTIFSQFCIGK